MQLWRSTHVLENCDYIKCDVCNMALEGRRRPEVFNTYAHSHYCVVPCILLSRYTRAILAVIGNTARLSIKTEHVSGLQTGVHKSLSSEGLSGRKHQNLLCYAKLSSFIHPPSCTCTEKMHKYQNKKGHKDFRSHRGVGVHTG